MIFTFLSAVVCDPTSLVPKPAPPKIPCCSPTAKTNCIQVSSVNSNKILNVLWAGVGNDNRTTKNRVKFNEKICNFRYKHTKRKKNDLLQKWGRGWKDNEWVCCKMASQMGVL